MTAKKRSTPPSSERRAAARRHPALGTLCHFNNPAGEPAGPGLVWNLSITGLSVVLRQQLEPGTSWKAKLVNATETYSLPITVRVTHAVPLPTGDFAIGGQFPRTLTADEMMPFLE